MSVLVQKLGLSSTGNRATWTFSAWIKRSRSLSSANEFIFSSNTERTGGGQYSSIYFENDCLSYYDYYSSAKRKYLHTNRKFRDVNGWYHIVVRVDTTQSTASDRIRFYVNGVQETSFSSSDYPAVNDNSSFVNMSGADNFVGTQTNNLSGHFLGTLSHVHLADGQSYAPTVFGSTDATTGEWKINTSPTVSYGTNGFFLFKNDNVITDRSGQGNNFSIGSGTLTKTEDCPSNVFATLNPLSTNSAVTLSKGNLEFNYTGGDAATFSTLAASSGKYYWEIKALGADASGVQKWTPGVIGAENHMFYNNRDGGYAPTAYAWYLGNGNIYNNNSSISSAYGTANQNDIIGVALDMDNLKLYFSKNGTFLNSGDPTSGATGTGAISLTASYSPFIPHAGEGSGGAINFVFNFGNGYFGTTAVSSAGTNASGNGIFEYDVPTGYTALSTKGLNL